MRSETARRSASPMALRPRRRVVRRSAFTLASRDAMTESSRSFSFWSSRRALYTSMAFSVKLSGWSERPGNLTFNNISVALRNPESFAVHAAKLSRQKRPVRQQPEMISDDENPDGCCHEENGAAEYQEYLRPRELPALALQHQQIAGEHTHKVEQVHGDGEEHQVENVGSGGDDGGENDDGQDGVTRVAHQKARRRDADQGQEKDKNRQLENTGDAENHVHEQIEILSNADHGLNI